MPTYDYKCSKCNAHFEATHKINAPRTTCPTCGDICEKLILSPPATHGHMAIGREEAARSLLQNQKNKLHLHGPGCGCSKNNYTPSSF